MIQHSHNNKQQAFTLIELMFVLVIMAILVIIGTMNYSGIQNRAKTAQYATDASMIAKKAEAAAGENDGQFALVATDFTGLGSIGDTTTNVTISTVIASSIAAPANAAALPNPPAYAIHVCNNTRSGVRIYYRDPQTNATSYKYVDSGKWSTGC